MSRYNARNAYLEIAKGNSSLDEYQKKGIAITKTRAYKIPTAEEMIGWLEEQENIDVIKINKGYKWSYSIYDKDFNPISAPNECYDSRKEATLTAIDSALDYLAIKKGGAE